MSDHTADLEISYALAKQLPSAYAIASSYGEFPLDDELRAAVDAAVRPILQRRRVLSAVLHREALDLAAAFVGDHDPAPTILELAALRSALRALSRLSVRLNLDCPAVPHLEAAEQTVVDLVKEFGAGRMTAQLTGERLDELADTLCAATPRETPR